MHKNQKRSAKGKFNWYSSFNQNDLKGLLGDFFGVKKLSELAKKDLDAVYARMGLEVNEKQEISQ